MKKINAAILKVPVLIFGMVYTNTHMIYVDNVSEICYNRV